jgi:NAD+ kinase
MNLIGIVADLTKLETIAFKDNVIKAYNCVDLNKNPELAQNVSKILVLGGDGFLLHVVHKFYHYRKPFFGINYGTVGFLLNNKIAVKNLPNALNQAVSTKLKFLNAVIETETEVIESFAMNEVTLFRASGQVAKIRVFVDEKLRLEELVSDGIILSTAAGSTAYNFSLHGPIFSPQANVLSLCPISPFRPRHFRGALLLENAKVKFEVLESTKRPVLASTDFNHFEGVKSVSVSVSKTNFVEILFTEDTSLNEKILAEQFLI